MTVWSAARRAARFDGWRRALPRPLGGAATFESSGGRVRIAIPYPAAAPLDQAYFFPVSVGVVDYAAPQTVVRDGDRLVIETRAGGASAVGPLLGVLRVGAGQALAITATAGVVTAAVPQPASGGLWRATLLALAGAMLGGLILNIMPCVFPILSLKALSLARGHLGEREARGTRRLPILPVSLRSASRLAVQSLACALAAVRSAGRSSCRMRASSSCCCC